MSNLNLNCFANAGKGRFDWHKRYHHDALNGMSAMTLEQRGAYCALIDLQYARRGPLIDDDAWLARQLNCSVRCWRRVRDELVAMGRIVRDLEAGTLYDERCMRELAGAEQLRETLSHHGREGAKKRAEKSPKKPPGEARSAVDVAEPETPTLVTSNVDQRPINGRSNALDIDLPEEKPNPISDEGEAYPEKKCKLLRIRERNTLPLELNPQAPASGAPPATLTGGGAPTAPSRGDRTGAAPRLRAKPGQAPPPLSEVERASALAAMREKLAAAYPDEFANLNAAAA